MSKTALITGVTGQDGAYLSELLLDKGYLVHGIKRRSSSFNTQRVDHLYKDPHESHPNFLLHYGDITDSTNLIRLIQETQPDEIYHLAAQSHVQVSFESPEYTANADGLGTLRLLEAFRILGMVDKVRFYNAATSELYGKVQEIPQTEKTPFYPRSPYGVAKLYGYWTTVNYREAYAIHAKGMEIPAYEPRGSKAMGFNYATANIGGSHCFGYASQEVFGNPVPRKIDRFAEEENADIVIFNQNGCARNEVGIMCSFAAGWYPSLFDKLLFAATGIEQVATRGYLGKVAERIINLERAFNVRQGFRREQDTLPQRILKEPLHTRGMPGEGQIVRNLDKFLDRYYELRGWTPQGIPSAQKLNDLGLGYVVKDMA